MPDKIKVDAVQLTKLRQIMISISDTLNARIKHLNYLLSVFDQQSSSTDILKQKMYYAIKDGTASTKGLNDLAMKLGKVIQTFKEADSKGLSINVDAI